MGKSVKGKKEKLESYLSLPFPSYPFTPVSISSVWLILRFWDVFQAQNGILTFSTGTVEKPVEKRVFRVTSS